MYYYYYYYYSSTNSNHATLMKSDIRIFYQTFTFDIWMLSKFDIIDTNDNIRWFHASEL